MSCLEAIYRYKNVETKEEYDLYYWLILLFLCGISLHDYNTSKMLLWIFNAIGYESELTQKKYSNLALFPNIWSRTQIVQMIYICFMNI